MKQYKFRRWLRNWVTNVDADQAIKATVPGVSRSIGDHRDAMNFQIIRATGGYVVEYHSYDRKRDESNRYLHIITDNNDLGDAIAKIVTIELLRN
jgi:hypothetical protein